MSDVERGASLLIKILAAALIAGLVVIAIHPLYRHAALAMLKGEPSESPIWKTNLEFYPEVGLEPTDGDHAEPQ